ncbi:ATP-binding cassette domain-containing protein, partial [Klebsiella pneumoniae]|uniref:ATP-binding cassette domain-containing protein n=1 Tax=Klebsiella pneumoniae TaxID=573 RepID=UPI00210E4633
MTKIFPGVRALENVQLDLWPGKVTALIGENGAGKSTLVLTPWAEATRDRARRAVHDARAVLQPSTETFSAQNLARLFTIRANSSSARQGSPRSS